MANKYKVDINHARQRRFLRFSRGLIILIVVTIVIILAYVIIDAILENRRSNSPSKPTNPVASTVEPNILVFPSPYFQFQTDKNWRFISNESTTTKFLYRRGTDNLVSGDMTVYINSGPSDSQATRVLPVSIGTDPFRLKSSFVSDHCNKNLTKEVRASVGEIALTLGSVRFLCDVDGTNFTVLVGLENGTQAMNLSRPDGTNANYTVFFRDLRFTPEPKEFETIMDSFQIR